MKKFLIILIFLFVSIFTYSDSAFSYSKSVNIDFDVRVMMGLTKIEENDNPKYKKFLDYINENLAKKGEVKYSHKLNMYRQEYCGCVFSKVEKEQRDKEKAEKEKQEETKND